jgi:Tol biopolymer transport system component
MKTLFITTFISLLLVTAFNCEDNTIGPGLIDYHNKILFTSSRSGKEQLYMMNPEGTNIIQLTSGQYWHNNGRWSPDAQKIVCNTEEGTTTAGTEMAVFNSDGSNRKLLSTGNNMSWSPDGYKIAFICMPMAEVGLRFRFIYTINADATGRKQVTNDSLEIISSPCWSNENNKIFFTSNRYNVTNYNTSELYYMTYNDSSVTRLTYTTHGSSYSPSISPSGNKIAFMSTMNDALKGSVYICDINGNNIKLIITPPENEIYNFPRWSPDEQFIIFVEVSTDSNEATSVYKIRVNGQNLTRLADNAGYPDWSK